MNAADDRVLFDQAPGEPSPAFHAFTHYRNLPSGDRSIDKAWREHQRRCRGVHGVTKSRAVPRWRIWASCWGWVERTAAWDAEQDRQAREKIAADQRDARIRHARMANAALQSLSVPSRALLEILQDPTVMPRLIAEAKESTRGVLKLVELVTWCGRVIPGLIQTERLSLGMSSDVIELVEEKRDDTIARRIIADEGATELAIRLLDSIAGTTEQEQHR